MALKVGDKVVLKGEYDWYGTHLCSWTKGMTFDVQQVGAESRGPDYIVVGLNGQVTAAVHEADLESVNKPKKQSSKPKETKPAYKVDANALVNNAVNNVLASISDGNNIDASMIPLGQGRVVTANKKYAASANGDDKYKMSTMYQDTNKPDPYITEVEYQSPRIVQNNYGFPVKNGYKNSVQKYSYENDYTIKNQSFSPDLKHKQSVLFDMAEIRRSLNLLNNTTTPSSLRAQYMQNYNRFKETYVDDMLNKTFAHVFFVRPNCNIYRPSSAILTKEAGALPDFYYAYKHNPLILQQLQQEFKGAPNHEFMFYPSNKVRSFEVADEYITTDTYGQSRTGYKVSYGKHNIESKTADKFSCTFIDDNRLTVYHVHKLWMDYISYVYRGELAPQQVYLTHKIIDYATCVYYILCAEDGETIIFWSKYTGVFPIKSPSSSFSYTAENPGGIQKPELNIEYQYAWKEDFNPLSLVEFNEHSTNVKYAYTSSFQASKLGPASTWSGAPFIETYRGTGNGNNFIFKLRFSIDKNAPEYK